MRNLTIKQHRRISLGIMVAGMLLLILADTVFRSKLLLFCGLVVLFGAAIYNFMFVRCPHCGAHPRTKYIPEFCPHCGKKISE